MKHAKHDVLPALTLLDDVVLERRLVDGFRDVSVTRDALHLGMVRELLLQFGVVVDGGSLARFQLNE